MHELAVAQSLVAEALRCAASHGARRIDSIVVRVGPLSGVEPSLLERAFTVARSGTSADQAVLSIETKPIEVSCTRCGETTEAKANKLVCGSCGDWRVRVIAGEELLLARLELSDIGVEIEDLCAIPAAAR
jgi:hydrogenase nickel incorporation protein HypA/HybF